MWKTDDLTQTLLRKARFESAKQESCVSGFKRKEVFQRGDVGEHGGGEITFLAENSERSAFTVGKRVWVRGFDQTKLTGVSPLLLPFPFFISLFLKTFPNSVKRSKSGKNELEGSVSGARNKSRAATGEI